MLEFSHTLTADGQVVCVEISGQERRALSCRRDSHHQVIILTSRDLAQGSCERAIIIPFPLSRLYTIPSPILYVRRGVNTVTAF